jgi:hypothetical protein
MMWEFGVSKREEMKFQQDISQSAERLLRLLGKRRFPHHEHHVGIVFLVLALKRGDYQVSLSLLINFLKAKLLSR